MISAWFAESESVTSPASVLDFETICSFTN
jgi:hypothetical protein